MIIVSLSICLPFLDEAELEKYLWYMYKLELLYIDFIENKWSAQKWWLCPS